MYLIRITAPDGPWSQALIPLEQIETDAPLVGVSATGSSLTITVTDADLDTVTVNGDRISDENGDFRETYPISCGGVYTVTATDKAGNATSRSVTVTLPVLLGTAVSVTADAKERAVTVLADHSQVTGGCYDPAISDPAANRYEVSYRYAIIKLESADSEPDVTGADWTDGFRTRAASEVSFRIAEEGVYVLAVRDSEGNVGFSAPITVTVTEERTEPTCDRDGEVVRTVKAVLDGTDGAEDRTTETIEATGHDYALTGWKWTGFSAAEAVFTCRNDKEHVKNVKADISEERTEPTADDPGSVVYTASVTFENKPYTSQKTEVLQPLGHAYELSVWTWDGYASATATFKDKNGGRDITLEADIEPVTKAPTCTADGWTEYTATVVFEGETYTDKQTETLSSPGHKPGDPVKENEIRAGCETEGSYVEVICCSVCGKELRREEKTVPAAGHKPGKAVRENEIKASCESAGSFVEVILCSECGAELSRKERIIAPLGHDWGEPVFVWSSDRTSAKATTTCRNDPSHTRTYNAAVRTETSSAFGDILRTATVTIDGRTYRDTIREVSQIRIPNIRLPIFDKDPEVKVPEQTAPETKTVPAAEPEEPGLPFVDVTPEDPFFDDVKYVYDRGIMNGVSATEFAPLTDLSRGMIVTVLYRMEGRPEIPEVGIFTDVPTGEWYSDGVVWAASKGIVLGYGDGRFGPGNPVTREQLAAILYRYAQYREYDVSVGGDTNILGCDDASDISGWAFPAMQWACGTDVLNSGSSAAIRPAEPASRSEIAHSIRAFLEKTAK